MARAKKAKAKPTPILIEDKIIEQIKKVRIAQQNIQLDVGQLEAQKHLLLHKLHTEGDALQELRANIEAMHGKGNVNIDTGEFIPVTENGNT